MKEYDLGLAETLIMVKEKRNIINPNKSFIKQLEVYEGILGAIRHRRNYVGLFRSKSESSLIPTSPCSQLEDRSPPPSTPTYRRGITESINIDIKALATVFDQSAAARPNSEPIFCGRPKSWSPNDKVAGFLLDRKQRQDQKETGKDEEEFEDDDCRCFGEQLSQNYSSSPSSSSPCLSSKVRRLSSALTSSSAATPGEASIIEARNSSLISSAPVNSKTVTLYNPNCPCDIELELGVPEDPVVLEEKTPDVRTDSVVHNLSNLSLQMRTNSQHLVDGLQTSPSLAGPQLQQQKSAQLLLRQSSLDRQFLDGKPSTTSTHDSDNKLILNEISSSRRGRKEDELSVKTLANMFDFKNCSVPMRPCSARLEDSHLFQKAAKNLAATTTTPANKTRNSNESETTQSDC